MPLGRVAAKYPTPILYAKKATTNNRYVVRDGLDANEMDMVVVVAVRVVWSAVDVVVVVVDAVLDGSVMGRREGRFFMQFLPLWKGDGVCVQKT